MTADDSSPTDDQPDGTPATAGGDRFTELVASRRAWIDSVLKPWCMIATRRELLQAEDEWTDIAGRADPKMTLWLWAWSRFPGLTVEGLNGLEESYEVCVTLCDGSQLCGFPDARHSLRGQLVLLASDGPTQPLSLDNIASCVRLESR